MSSKLFNGLTPIKAHRLVNEQLKDVIKDIHGLQVRQNSRFLCNRPLLLTGVRWKQLKTVPEE